MMRVNERLPRRSKREKNFILFKDWRPETGLLSVEGEVSPVLHVFSEMLEQLFRPQIQEDKEFETLAGFL